MMIENYSYLAEGVLSYREHLGAVPQVALGFLTVITYLTDVVYTI